MELSVCFHQPSGAFWSKSAYLRNPQLQMGSVEDHLDPSRHLWSHPVLVSTHQEPSASFGVCRRPSGPIKTSPELSVCFQKPSGHISCIQGLSETICTHRH